MVLPDLTNPIYIPNGLDTANNNPVAMSSKIVRQGQNESVEEALVALEGSVVSGELPLSFISDNREYYRFSDDNFEVIGVLPVNNANLLLTGFRANVYAQSNNVDAIYIRLRDSDTLTTLGTLTINSPSTDITNISALQVLSNIPPATTTELNVQIEVARDESGGMNEGRLAMLNIYYNVR